MPKKLDKVRVNVRTTVVNKNIRKTKRNDRDVWIVPSATLPDNVVMNGISYPAEEIANSFHTLERSPAPAGHPTIKGNFVSASDPEGINVGWIGAWNENVRQEDGRVLLDKVIDIETANQTERGREVINAIEKEDPIHTSTGLWGNLVEAEEGDDFEYVFSNMVFDHDAILVNEEGAATPDQGVGIFVNSDGKSSEVTVINSSVDDADREIDWAGQYLVRALEQRESATKWEQMKPKLLELLGLSSKGTNTSEGDAEMADSKELEALSAQVTASNKTIDTMAEALAGLPAAIANAVTEANKPLADSVAALNAAATATADAELDGLRKSIVAANIMSENDAKELTLNTARALAPKDGTARPAAGAINSAAPAGGASEDDKWKGYSMNAHAEEGVKQ